MAKGATRRTRNVKILATIGPGSSSAEMLEKLYLAGVDAFRIDMSHGGHDGHLQVINHIRALEKKYQRPMTILCDLQGPKLRIGTFADGAAELVEGEEFLLDRDPTPGDARRVCLPHGEIMEALEEGARLLLDDGKRVLRVLANHGERVVTRVEVGGRISDRKGLNVPDTLVPLAALTDKDRRDLAFALKHEADWVALSFVQRPDDVAEARRLIGGKAALISKIEKPSALGSLDEILELSDAVMVARGDLGVELPPERVPPLQKQIVERARMQGKPVVVATQMLESMIESPAPTRAEVSDVATAVYDGADAVMLSAETAVGDYPVEAVQMMDRIARTVEGDAGYGARVHFTETLPDATTADAIANSASRIADTISVSTIICFTMSGSTARRVARERPSVPLMVLTPSRVTARRVGLVWGAYAVATRDIGSFEEMIAKGKRMALRHGFGEAGAKLVMIAGVPFGTPGSTNVLHVVTLSGDELKGYTD